MNTSDCSGLPQGGSFGCSYSITFRVQVPSHFHCVTWFALFYVLVHSGLQKVSILPFRLSHPYDTFICCLHKYSRLCGLHVGPHLLEYSNLWSLRILWSMFLIEIWSLLILSQISKRSYPEELFGRSSIQSPVGNLCLLRQVLCALDGWHHPLHCEEGCQVGCVGGDDNQGEEPPHTSNYTTRERSKRSSKIKQVVNTLKNCSQAHNRLSLFNTIYASGTAGSYIYC